MTNRKPKIVVILGPTASGKSALAVKLAKSCNGEIISADSRQIYKGLDIGSGKITDKEMLGIPHHLLDVVSPKRIFTVAQYQTLSQKIIEDILRRGKLPIVVGGTGFYIDSLIYNSKLPEVKPNPKLRKQLERETADALFNKLQSHDPARAKTIDRHNKRRLIRALEIINTTNAPIPKLRLRNKYRVLYIGIRPPEQILKRKIRARLLKRVRQGMIEEVKNLHKQGVSWKRLDDLGLEYRYVSHYLRGFFGKEKMLEKLEIEIQRYAKRQMTWFKRNKNIIWVDGYQQTHERARTHLLEK